MKTRVALTEFIDELIYQVVLSNRHLSDAAEMPDSEYKALRFVHRNNEVSMRGLSAFLGVSLPRATKIADALVDTGYCHRCPGPDRRCVNLRLTEKGQSAIDEATKMHQDLSEAILAPLNKAERGQMYQLIKKCYQEFRDKSA
jgi:DNA-binding MarR family transcriptional regulator